MSTGTENPREAFASATEAIMREQKCSYEMAASEARQKFPKLLAAMARQDDALFCATEPVTPEPKRDANFSASVGHHFSAGVQHAIQHESPDVAFAAAATEISEREHCDYETACQRVRSRFPQLFSAYGRQLDAHIELLFANQAELARVRVPLPDPKLAHEIMLAQFQRDQKAMARAFGR